MVIKGNHADLSRMFTKTASVQLPLMVHGTFGIGKTRGIEEACRAQAGKLKLEFSKDVKDINNEKKFVFLGIRLPLWDAAALQGLPFPDETREKMVFLPPQLLPMKGHGCIFLDEINLAPPLIQSNAYQILEEHRVGQHIISPNYCIVAAGNKDDDRGNTFEMANPLKNRMLHFELNVPTVDEWVTWAMLHDIDNRIINYHLGCRTDLFTYNPEDPAMDSMVTYATPRMWEYVSRLITGEKDDAFVQSLVASGVGTGIATKFSAWLRMMQSYDVTKIFNTGKLVIPDDGDISKLYALIASLVAFYVEHKEDEQVQKTLAVLSQKFEKEHMMMLLHQVCVKDKTYILKLKGIDVKLFEEISQTVIDMY